MERLGIKRLDRLIFYHGCLLAGALVAKYECRSDVGEIPRLEERSNTRFKQNISLNHTLHLLAHEQTAAREINAVHLIRWGPTFPKRFGSISEHGSTIEFLGITLYAVQDSFHTVVVS